MRPLNRPINLDEASGCSSPNISNSSSLHHFLSGERKYLFHPLGGENHVSHLPTQATSNEQMNSRSTRRRRLGVWTPGAVVVWRRSPCSCLPAAVCCGEQCLDEVSDHRLTPVLCVCVCEKAFHFSGLGIPGNLDKHKLTHWSSCCDCCVASLCDPSGRIRSGSNVDSSSSSSSP